MQKIGMVSALKMCRKYKNMTTNARMEQQKKRLESLVAYAKSNSPYFAEVYHNIPEHFTLSDLPATNKRELMEHWNQWLTEREVSLSEIEQFLYNKDNIGRKWKNKYMVVTTSGSTGNPLIMLCDSTVNNVIAAVSTERAYARKEDMMAFIRSGGKSMGIYADSGFYLGNSSIRAKQLMMPWKKRQIGLSSALYPTQTIVEQLNKFQPAMLGGYPSNLELLIEEQISGRLHISPVIIMTGGEYLSDTLRQQLADTFHCYVQTAYACTEGGTIACECREKHLHVNDDWLIVEPVDKDGKPVPDGVLADKILLTNLYNYTQPIIRYEVTDRMILHHEKCTCGNPSPWIEIEGRNDDVIILTAGKKTVRIPPLAVYAKLKEVHELRRFQLLVNPANHLELRLEPAKGVESSTAFEKARNALSEQFGVYGVTDVTITLSKEQPKQHPVSGKFKHIIVNS